MRSHWRGQTDVRFQPYRLANSKCFDGTDPRISCVACHDPHKKVVRDSPSYYDPKCLACHAPLLPKRSRRNPRKGLPGRQIELRQLPHAKVSLPNGLMQFSDHQIRIVKTGEPFPN